MAMANRYARSSMKSEKVRIKLLIENFSVHVCKGFYATPTFKTESSRSHWSLVVRANGGGASYENFIDVYLMREEYEIDEQFVEVKASIVDSCGFSRFESKKEIFFNGSEDAQILSITKQSLRRDVGLDESCFLPNDTLTLRCEFVVFEENVFSFDSREVYVENLTKSCVPLDRNSNCSEYFVRSRVATETFDFERRIENFSLYACKGRLLCPEYQSSSSGSTWNLVVYVNDYDELFDEIIDVRLQSRGWEDTQSAKVKLSIIDPSGNALMSEEKLVYFTGSNEAKVLSVKKEHLWSWFGLKGRLISDDTFSLRCEVEAYKDVSTFECKEDFDFHLESSRGSAAKKMIQWLKSVWLILLAVVLCVLRNTRYVILHVIIPLVWNYAIPFVVRMTIAALKFSWPHIKNAVCYLILCICPFLQPRFSGVKNYPLKRKFRNQTQGPWYDNEQQLVPYRNRNVASYHKVPVYGSKQFSNVVYANRKRNYRHDNYQYNGSYGYNCYYVISSYR